MISSAQYSVDGTAVKIAESTVGMKKAYVHVVGNQIVYLGKSNVTSTTGLYVDKNAGIVTITLAKNDELWAIAAAGQTETVTVLIGD